MVVAVYIGLCLIWGSTWLAITYVIDDVPSCTAAAARFWVATAVYLVVHVFRRIRFPADWRTRLGMVACGAPQIGISYSLVYWAEGHISSGLTAVLFATFPFFVAIFSAWLVEGEGWTRAKLIGLVCGMFGVSIVFMDQLEVESMTKPMAVAAVIAAAFSCGASVVWIKRHYMRYDTVALTASQLLGGSIALTAAAFVFESPLSAPWTPSAIFATLYLAVLGSAVAFFGYYWLLKRIEGTAVAAINFVTPVLAVFLGWLFRDETITPWLLIGGGLVFAGIRLVVRSQARRNGTERSGRVAAA